MDLDAAGSWIRLVDPPLGDDRTGRLAFAMLTPQSDCNENSEDPTHGG
jgi:hypothetical protein